MKKTSIFVFYEIRNTVYDCLVKGYNISPFVSSSPIEEIENPTGNKRFREVVHTAEIPFRTAITADVRAWPASESFGFEQFER